MVVGRALGVDLDVGDPWQDWLAWLHSEPAVRDPRRLALESALELDG